MFKNTGYRANWLPDHPLRIGDIGKLEDGLFTLYTTLEQQQIGYSLREGNSELDVDYSSKNSVNIETSVSTGDALNLSLSTPVNGRVIINFTESNGIVFQMTGAKKKVIENLAEVENTVLNKYRSGEWPKEWVVISEVVVTDHATIIISTSSNNKIELGCNAQLGIAQGKLADPKLNLTLISEKGSSTKIFGANNLTPFYQVKGIYKPFLRKPQFRKRADITDELETSEVTDLGFDLREL
ncbi:hypothetical protein [Mucilaginibacter sp.]|uniref:hypothetical protein n=1 Tax=Mucilaginibacter sp. TaxID=1882438 RepID=UPI002638E96A|nr:hypothetical protein [Mucilaginibacter sp.]